MPSSPAILQFGTSRFLQAHADLFVSEALERGEAIGTIAVVQTTDNPASAARIAALAGEAGYPVRIRGIHQGREIDEERRGRAIRAAYGADREWAQVRRLAIEAQVILSNTGDRGYDLDARDDAALVGDVDRVPRSFPAKLAILLHARWQTRAHAALSVFPCELISANGDTLRTLVSRLAQEWGLPDAFLRYLSDHALWANSLVDRIVSEPIQPVGAVAEPYALWAIQRQADLVVPCRHEAIVLTDDLNRYERLKLQLLNLGHSVLAEAWLAEGGAPDRTVLQAVQDPVTCGLLERVWTKEVLPVFAADGLGTEAEAYVATVRERFMNPFLAHRLADVAQNHAEKKRRRMLPVVQAAERQGASLAQPFLRQALG